MNVFEHTINFFKTRKPERKFENNDSDKKVVENFQFQLDDLLTKMRAEEKYSEIISQFDSKVKENDFTGENLFKEKYDWLKAKKDEIDKKNSIDEASEFVEETMEVDKDDDTTNTPKNIAA